MPNSFRKTFTTSTSHQVIFKTKTKTIGLTMTRTEGKTKNRDLSIQRTTLVINQIKVYIKDHI